MKNKLLISLLLIMFGTVFTAEAQSKQDTRNVLDYYKLLSSDMVALSLGKDANRDPGMEPKITIEDTKNGYLRLEGAIEGWVEVALFRKKNGIPVLVVGETDCGPACGTELSFFELIDGKMVDVSRKMGFLFFENEIDDKLFRKHGKQEDGYYGDILDILPRTGTTIKTVLENEEEVLFETEWKNDNFVVKRDVLDFYAIFSGNLLAPDSESKGKVVVNDPDNGYLRIDSENETHEAALFHKKDGSPILFLTKNSCSEGACFTSNLEIRELVSDKWVDVSGEVLPPGITDKSLNAKTTSVGYSSFYYMLPRYGRTVEIVETDVKKTIYKMEWKGEKFVIQ